MCHRGFTIAELLTGMTISAIVVLMVAAIGSIAVKSYKDLRSRADVYSDSQSVLQMVRESVRQSVAVPGVSFANSNNCLTVVVPGGTVYIHGQGATSVRDLVYGNSCSNATSTLISGVSVAGASFFTPAVNGQMVTVSLSGSKNGAAFSYAISMTRRNP